MIDNDAEVVIAAYDAAEVHTAVHYFMPIMSTYLVRAGKSLVHKTIVTSLH